jgi:raffinose/stachyose/melibiose transport system permease protein
MVLQNGVGFFLAYALWRELPGARFHRVAVFLPVVLSTIIVAYLFKLFLHPLFGVVNVTLKTIGLPMLAQPWLGQDSTALWALIFANAWHMVGFPTLVFLAGMQRIPSEILDAVRMETKSEWVKIVKIVWPLVAPSATVVFVLLFVGAFNWFELPYIMAGLDGSPYGSTDVLGLYFYRTAFGNVSGGSQDFGLGSALAVLIFIFIALIASVITVRLRAREIQI